MVTRLYIPVVHSQGERLTKLLNLIALVMVAVDITLQSCFLSGNEIFSPV